MYFRISHTRALSNTSLCVESWCKETPLILFPSLPNAGVHRFFVFGAGCFGVVMGIFRVAIFSLPLTS